MARHPKVSKYFISFKVKVCSKLKPKTNSFKEKADLNLKSEYNAKSSMRG